jgi:hypothetical protein
VAETHGLSARETAQRMQKAFDEELRHKAHHNGAESVYEGLKGKRARAEGGRLEADVEAWRAQHYGNIWQSEFTAEGRQAVLHAYGWTQQANGTIVDKTGKPVEAWKAAFEGIRMISQERALGGSSEQSKLLVPQPKGVIEHLKAALAYLKELAKKTFSPQIEADIAHIETVMGQWQRTAGARANQTEGSGTVEMQESTAQGALVGGSSVLGASPLRTPEAAIGGLNAEIYGADHALARQDQASTEQARRLAEDGAQALRPKNTAATPDALEEQRDRGDTANEEYEALFDWAWNQGLSIDPFPARFALGPRNDKGHAEHHVLFNKGDARVVKITRVRSAHSQETSGPGDQRFGVWPQAVGDSWKMTRTGATAGRYMERLVNTNREFGSDFVVHGACQDQDSNLQIVTSQPLHKGTLVEDTVDQQQGATREEKRENARKPVRDDLKKLGFLPVGTDNKTYYRAADNTAIFDANTSNLMWVTKGKKRVLVPLE